MNKNCYRIVFNAKRGMRMAVAETATAQGKNAGGETRGGLMDRLTGSLIATLRPTSFAISAALGLVLWAQAPARAQIVADPSAPASQRATVLQTANGLPQVNIQTPSAAGVSPNTYSQFDVSQPGAILNNSRSNVQTQTGGWVQGNPWLATGSARVILNEVNSANPSQLKGYVEVAGQRADVIIANPAGIAVNGGGFLNASSVTLTTGTPVMNTGSLEAYRVQRGSVSIDGAGLDTSTADYTNILARAVQVNAGIWAKDLKVVTGANDIAASNAASPTVTGATTAANAAPAYLLDVSQLGGMYAGKIFLVGTEAGLGVRNAGVIGATAGDVVLQNDGWLSNSGTLYASGNTSVTSQSGISNQANGLIAAQGNTALQAGGQVNAAAGSVIAAGLKPDGSVAATGDLTVKASEAVALNGQTSAGGDASVSATHINLTSGTLSAQNISLSASTGDINASGATVNAQATLQASTQATLITDGAKVSATQLQLAAHDLSNVGGEILQTGAADTAIALAGDLNNTQGRIAANSQKLTLTADTLTNTDGKIEHAGAGALTLNANTLTNQWGQITGNGNTALNTATFVNTGSVYAVGNQTLNASGAISNTGVIAAFGDTTVSAGSLTSSAASLLGAGIKADGSLANTGNLSVATTQALTATGQNLAAGNSTLSGSSVDLSGSQTSAANIGLTATSGNVTTSNATVTTLGTLRVTAQAQGTQTLVNTHGTLSAGQLTLDISNLNNSAGSFYASGDLSTHATNVSNTGSLYAAGNQTLDAGGTVNNTGVIAARGNNTLNANSLGSSATSLLGAGINADGSLASAGNLSVVTAQGLTSAGQNLAAGNASLSGAAIDVAGSQTSAANITLTALSGDVNTSAATVSSPGILSITARAQNAQTLVNRQGTLSAAQLDLNIANLNNSQGEIIQTGSGNTTVVLTSPSGTLDNTQGRIATNSQNLILGANTITNTDGHIEHAGSGALSINTTTLNDLRGKITGNGALNINTGAFNHDNASTVAQQISVAAASLSNRAGEIIQTGAGSTHITASGALDNSAGTLASNGDITLTAGSLNNSQGTITAGGALTGFVSQGIVNTKGLIAANADVTLVAAALDNSQGTLASVQGSLNASTTGTTRNDSGTLQAALDATLNNAGLSNTQGTITATRTASLQTGALNNDGGLIQAGTALRINTGGQTLVNTRAANHATGAGGISSQGTVDLVTGDLNNAAGYIGAKGAMTASTGKVSNTQGAQIVGQSDVSFSATGFDNTAGSSGSQGGQVQALGDVSLDVGAGTIDNTASLIRSAQTASLTAAAVTNSNTQGTGQGIEGNNIAITAAAIANNSGALRADNNITLTSSGTLDNRAGLISADKVLIVQDLAANRTLLVTNTSGTLVAGQSVDVSAASLSGDGKVLSKGDLSISLTTDFNNTSSGEVTANGNASLSTTGNFNNSSKLEAGQTLTVRAADITNTSTLVGASVTLQASQRVLNLGPQALIGASASTGLLQILAPEIINRDDVTATDTAAQTSIVGLGTVVLAGGIDGAGNYTAANTVRNESGYISSGADMSIYADTLSNTRRILQTSDTYTPTGQTVQGQVVWTAATPDVPGGRYIEPPHGGYMNSDYLYTAYQGTVARNSITQISPQAVIEAGANFNPVVTRLQNYWSVVTAAGNIALNGVTLDQDGWQNGNSANPGVAITPYGESVIYSGTYEYRTYRDTYWSNAWGPSSPVVTPLGGFDASLSAGGTISGSGNTLINTSGVNPNTPLGAQSGLSQGTAGAGTVVNPIIQALGSSVNSVTGAGGAGAASGLLQSPSTALTTTTLLPASVGSGQAIPAIGSLLPKFSLPTGGLYHTNPNPASRYLIETNPAFTSNQQWLSSDYYFEQLGLDPTVTQKRLGDGFYEQQLIKEQLIGLTGRAVLEYPDAQSQYRALMQAGAAYAKQLQLAPGIALSAAQVAQLSSDVVILQEAQVNGQVVLVPVVYLSPNQGQRLLPTGSLIAANNIELTNSQSITNSGTIRAQQNLSLDALNIDSRGGQLQSGALMQLTSQKDIDLTSATLKAGSLRLEAGRNILLNTDATQVSSAVQGGSRVRTQFGQSASIDVAGDALIKSGGNFEQNAGTLTIGGNLQTNIGGNWTLGAVQSLETTHAQTASGHANTEVVQQRTSSLTVGGQSNLQVANNFSAQGAAITLQGPALLHAGGNLTLSAVKDSISVDSTSASSDHSEKTQSFNQTVRGTTIQAGNNLTLTSGKDLTLQAATVNVAQGTAQIQAAGNVKIEADTERHQSDNQHTGSHAGLFNSTSIADHNTIDRSDNIGSTISATSVNVVAGKDINVKGSSVVSDQATTLIAKNNVTIEAARNTLSQSSFHEETKSGLFSSGGLSLTLGQQAQSADAKNRSTTAAASTVGLDAAALYRQLTVFTRTGGADVDVAAGLHCAACCGVAGLHAVALAAAGADAQADVDATGFAYAFAGVHGGTGGCDAVDGALGAQGGTGRAQGLHAAVFGLAGSLGYSGGALQGGEHRCGEGQALAVAQAAAAVAADGGSVSVSLTANHSESTTKQTDSSTSNAGSQLSAGRNVQITATGTGSDATNINNGNVNLIGSSVSAGNNVQLKASKDIFIVSAQDTEAHQTDHSDWTVGAGVGVAASSSGGASLGVTANAGVGVATQKSQASTQLNSHITAGNNLSVESSRDTNIQGGVLSADSVSADVGRTRSGISGATLTIGTKTTHTDQGQTATDSSGKAINTGVTTGVDTTAKLAKPSSLEDIQAQVQITQSFGSQASKAVGDYAGSKRDELTAQAKNTSDPTQRQALLDEAAKWDEGGAYHDPGKGLNAHEAGTQDKAQTTLVATTLSGQNIQLKATGDTGSNGSITLAGVLATTLGTLSLDAGSNGTLNLNNASTESSQANSHTSGDIVYQKLQGQGSQSESGHANVLNVGQLNVTAATINVPLAQSLQQLTQQPGMDYLSQLLKAPQLQGKVNWSAVELAHQNWNYEQQGLTPAGAAIVAIVVAYFTAGAASGVGVSAAEGAGFATTTTAAGTTVMTTTAGSMVAGATAAAVTTLATQASISLINNQGDIGKTLNDLGSSDNVKGLVTAMLTGGALAGLNFSPTGQPTVNGGAQSFSSQLGKNLQAGVARSLISTAINGGSLEDSLQTAITAALIDTGAAQGAFVIGGNVTGLANKLAHALAGCAAGAARAGAGEGCAAGAIGAAVGEMAAEAYGKRPDTVEFAAMISGIAAAVAGGDASQIILASQAGANAAANNYLKHAERVALNNAQKACFADSSSPSCGTATALQIKDQVSDRLLANATATCTGSECNDVSNFIQKAMSALGCTAPSACPDFGSLSKYWSVAQAKAQGLEPVYPEGWILDATAALDLGKFGVKLLTGASSSAKGSLDALSQLGKVDASSVSVVNNFYRDGSIVDIGTSRMVTNPNEAVFWSGRSDGIGGIDAAKSIANQFQGRTLEQLIESRQITMPMYDPNVPSSVQAWQSISTELAKNASGDVRAVIGSQMRPKSIWETYELPTLISNPAVSRIIVVDPKTGVEQVIFQRGIK